MKGQRHFNSTTQLLAVIILIQLSWCSIWPLDPDKNINQYLVDQWDMADGLPSNEIRSITQTPDGYLWLATPKGLVRFDGMRFLTIPFADKEKIDPLKTIIPDTLFVDRDGLLWIGSTGVLTSYNYKTVRFRTFTSDDGLTGDRIRRIKSDMKGNLWISFWSSYVNRFSNGKYTAYNTSHGLSGKKINSIIEDQKGNLLFGSRENGVFKYKDGKFFEYPVENLGDSQIITMHEDWKGDLWIGTDNGLIRITGKSTTRYSAANGLSNDYVTDIKEDSEHNLWIGTVKGLNRVKRRQNGAIVFESLLKSFIITCILEDREKNLWVGTVDSGLKRLKDRTFMPYPPLEPYREEMLLSMCEDRYGDTWIGTFIGKLFHCRSSGVIETIEIPDLTGSRITAITEDAYGNLWLGTIGKGVFQKKKGTFIQFTIRDGLSDNTVTSIYKDSWNNLWFSTLDGTSVRSPDGGFDSFNSQDGLLGRTVHNVYEDKAHNIWIAADRGITLLTKIIGGPPLGGAFFQKGSWSPKAILPGISVTCIYEDPSSPDGEGSIYWIATDGAGLKRLKLADDTITSYTTAEGMPTNSIYQFFEDQQGHFWLMSNSGILRLSKNALNRFASGELPNVNCTTFGISDGMMSLEFHNKHSRHSALKTRKGKLWFITKKGISIVDPDNVRINKEPPPVVIEAVFFDQQSIPLHLDASPNACKGITNFSFHFTAPTFLSPEKIIFRYQLEGFERGWIFLAPGQERFADYTNLAPDTYTFRVTACNAEGIWNRTGDSFTFTLKPFFYQTILFKVAVLFLFTSLVAAAIYIYKKRPFDKKKKPKVSSLNPHFVKAKVKKLNALMENEKVYRIANVSLESLAKKLDIPPYQLSLILNETLNQRFPDFINSYRIEEAKEILASPRGAKIKNTAVAYEVGFNSITAFYKTFQKFTHMTPNQYKKEEKKEKR